MTNRRAVPDVDPVFYESMLERWQEDPTSVDESWRALFAELEEDAGQPAAPEANGEAVGAPSGLVDAVVRRAYRERGHLYADSNPLAPPEGSVDLAAYGLGDAVPSSLKAELEAAYCGTLTAEFMHLDDEGPHDWLAQAMETGFGAPGPADQARILDLLNQAETFERFMQTKLPTTKRYGMEGSESQMPLCERLLECAVERGVDEIVLGPMHRGRTTFMALFMQKPLPAVFSEFLGQPWFPDDMDIAGDVPFHMGYSVDRSLDGRTVHISMASHPSHVETVIPVSLGKARARRSQGSANVLGLMMHTDAGFAGQGIVAETFQLSAVEGYETGGSIHVIANNQVGFTTRPEHARSSRYCSDMGKIVQAPVLRVNADDPEAAWRAASIAVAFWAEFHRDIIIDLVCYRRQGHNELDEPRYTQPAMYATIEQLPTVCAAYRDRLLATGRIDDDRFESRSREHWERFEAAFASAESYKPNKPGRFERHWTGLNHRDLETVTGQPVTGVRVADLKRYGEAQARWPDEASFNSRLIGQLEARAQSVADGDAINWSTAEALAFASLLADGVPIRLTGEDTRRGTFSQRHAVMFDQHTEAPYVPLNHITEGQAEIEVHDSPLSEEAVLAFEYGHSLADPETLVVWEAQFGDFANVAQVFIDQYIAPGEEKWLRSSGLVMLLPHGLEGGGPEHSSARLERFLQLCAKGNMHVVNCTTPANHFHALRRQMCRDFRKPLIAMTPKLLLRHKEAVSDLKDMGAGTSFVPVIADPRKPAGGARLIVCSGRVYYELEAARRERGLDQIALVRIEELYPFPDDELAEALAPHSGADVVWCQEEPENMGAWSFIDRRLEAVLKKAGWTDPKVRYAGRPANPSPAPAFKRQYEREKVALIDEALHTLDTE